MEGDGKGYLFIAGVNISDIFFDESGQFLHIQQGEQKVQIPVEDAAGRLELKGELLIVYDETGFPQAVFDAEDPEAGWNFVDPGEKGEVAALFDEHGFDMGELDFVFEEGVIRGYDAEGKLVFEDGKFDIRWAVLNLYNEGDNDLFSTYDLESGPVEPGHSSGVSQKDYNRYFLPLYLEKEEIFKQHIQQNVPGASGLAAFQVVIDPDKLAWGQIFYVYDPETKKPGPFHYLMYEKADGELIVMEAIANLDREQIIVFNEEQNLWAKDQLPDDQ
ncbi:MAG: hypothetical protein JETCAE01_13850 [Anaerolineaceae bacterium]|nr:MAG: hypothetical protein JETCAE01_13850 [Anaerolineaceae bacterium]